MRRPVPPTTFRTDSRETLRDLKQLRDHCQDILDWIDEVAGGGGAALSDDVPQPVSTGAGGPGTDSEASRADHIHNVDDSRWPSTTEKEALAGTDGSPSDTNRYVTDSDPRLTGGGGTTKLRAAWHLAYDIVPGSDLSSDAWNLTFDDAVSTQADLTVLGWEIQDFSCNPMARVGPFDFGSNAATLAANTYVSSVYGNILFIRMASNGVIFKSITDGLNYDIITRTRSVSDFNFFTEQGIAVWNDPGIPLVPTFNGCFRNLHTAYQRLATNEVRRWDGTGSLVTTGTTGKGGPFSDLQTMGVRAADPGTAFISGSAGNYAYNEIYGIETNFATNQQAIGTWDASRIKQAGLFFVTTAQPAYMAIKSIQRVPRP